MYSQNNEEQIIKDFFGGYKGVFADLGCNDGETLSNTRSLALSGWKGILCDASPSAMLKTNRIYVGNPDFELYQFALSDTNGETILHESGRHLGGDDVALVSSIIPEETERWKLANNEFREVKVKTITWPTLLSRSQFKKIDMFSIDCEGAELQFLPDIDFDYLETKLVCVEWNSKEENRNYYSDLFKRIYGFRLHAVNAENLIYVKK